MVNLLSNAIKFTEKSDIRKIKIGLDILKMTDTFVHLLVFIKDTGF
jgi:signal transduction histidine kinase